MTDKKKPPPRETIPPGVMYAIQPDGGFPTMAQPGATTRQPGPMPGAPLAPGMPYPGAPAMPAMPQQGMNPMLMMQMQMMQMMMGGGYGMPQVDPSAIPFAPVSAAPDADAGLDAAIIRPATFDVLIKHQQAIPLGSILDQLCLTEDAQHSLGGVPQGCTIALAGPPGKGKTRSALAGLAKVAASGTKVALVVAEEGFHDGEDAGRDDLCSRLVKIGISVTGLSEAEFRARVLENVYVLESQYHKGQTWDDFVSKYRYLVERAEIRFVVIDSLNMLDPTKNRTADNLSALKTYNHEKGLTCLCIGQIRDTGLPVGGEALMHTADVVFLIEELSLSSKEMAALWGGSYRDRIDVIRAVKSVTTPTFVHPIRVDRAPGTGALIAHAAQPADFALLPPRG